MIHYLKYIIILIIFNISIKAGFPQTFSPKIFPTLGKSKLIGNVSMSYSIGPTAVHTVHNSDYKLSQGFQQPEVQIRTGAIIGSFCQGSAIKIPFQADGIIGSNNIFTAQLSNSSGSFSSPVNIGIVNGNTSGNINCFIPLNTISGNAYRIRVISSLPIFNGTDNGSNIVIELNNCNLRLNLKLFTEGYFLGSGYMNPVLLNQNVVTSDTICDIIYVELRNSIPPYEVVSSTSAFIKTNGTASCTFNANDGSYYIAVKHRNSIETWSKVPKIITSTPTSYDFTNAGN